MFRFRDISAYQAGYPVEADQSGIISLKATEGESWRSPYFPEQRAQAHASGKTVLIYHYLRANEGVAEANNFLEHTGGLQPDEIAVCDYEAAGGPGVSAGTLADTDIPELGTPMGSWFHRGDHIRVEEVPASQWLVMSLAQGYAGEWLSIIHSATNRTPILYSYSSYLAARPTEQLTGWPLWIASYGVNDGQPHSLPNTDRWAAYQDGPGTFPHGGRTVAWQFTSEAHYPWWGGRLDDNETHLPVEGWKHWGGVAQPQTDRWDLRGRPFQVYAGMERP